nr:MAG TPA: hypothetical protein [Caudoviricetes sp.]
MFKGNTKIELTNIYTGEKEVIEKHNTFTNAIQKLLEYYTATGSNIYNISSGNPFLPLSTVGLSGIYLSSDTLDERTTQVQPRNIIGYAGFKTDISGSKYMGSLNTTESKQLENGYKYVWDFGTDRANGTISTVGLTSGIDNVISKSDNFPYVLKYMYTGNYITNIPWLGQCIDSTEFGQKFMFAALITPTTVKFTQIQITYGIVTLSNTPIYKIIKEETITIPDLSITIDANGFYHNTACYISFDVKNKFYYLITPSKYIRFNANTLQYDSSFGVKSMPSIYSSESNFGYAGVINGYMYRYKSYDLYRWKVDSPENISKYWKRATNSYIQLNAVGDYFINYNKIFDPEEKKIYTINNDDDYTSRNPPMSYPVPSSDNTNIYLSSYNDSVGNSNLTSFCGYAYANNNNYQMRCGVVYYPYFATINNLSSSVVKTADKTMKITYTLTEGE